MRCRAITAGPLCFIACVKRSLPGDNGGWANRTRIEVVHESSRYTAGFKLPSVHGRIEALGWELRICMEYGL